MNKKTFILEQLKNWYVIDNILLECDPKRCIKKGKMLKEYLAMKTAFIMTLHEFYVHKKLKTIKYDVKDSNILQEQAQEYAKDIKKLSAYMSANPKIKSKLTEKVIHESKQFKNEEINSVSKLIVEQNFLKLSMDNALIGKPLLENKIETLPTLDDMKGSIIYEAYKIQRDALIKFALNWKYVK